MEQVEREMHFRRPRQVAPNHEAPSGGNSCHSEGMASSSKFVPVSRPARALAPSAQLIRDWGGHAHVVDVIEAGYLFETAVSIADCHSEQDHRRSLVRPSVLRDTFMNVRSGDTGNAASRLRCAIHTRKSTEDGLAQEVDGLDAQSEACAKSGLSAHISRRLCQEINWRDR